jgi:hypothetical protein
METNYKVRFNLRDLLETDECTVLLFNINEPKLMSYLKPDKMDLVIIKNTNGELSVGHYGEVLDFNYNGVKEVYAVMFLEKISDFEQRIVAGTSKLGLNPWILTTGEKDFEHIGTELYREVDTELILRLVDVIEYPGSELHPYIDNFVESEETMHDLERHLNFFFIWSDWIENLNYALLVDDFFIFAHESISNE